MSKDALKVLLLNRQKTKKLHIVRYKYPQRKINNSNVEFHIFKSNGKFSEALHLEDNLENQS